MCGSDLLSGTSGDTGGSAIQSAKGLSGLDILVVYPRGRISAVQEKHMITCLEDNIHVFSGRPCSHPQVVYWNPQRLIWSGFCPLSRRQLGRHRSAYPSALCWSEPGVISWPHEPQFRQLVQSHGPGSPLPVCLPGAQRGGGGWAGGRPAWAGGGGSHWGGRKHHRWVWVKHLLRLSVFSV